MSRSGGPRSYRFLVAPFVASALIAIVPSPVHAQTKPPAKVPSPSAISTVSAAIAQALAGVRGPALVVPGGIASDAIAPRSADLLSTVATQIAGRFGTGFRAAAGPVELKAARQAARGASALVYLHLAVATGKLRVTADVYPVPQGLWARIRDPEPGPVAHAFAEAPLDAEVRTFLLPIPLVAADVQRAKNFEGDVVALACGDLDGDGASEIVAVGRRRVSVERLRGGRVIPTFSRNWPDLVGVAPAPLREPFAFATVHVLTEAPGLDVGLSDRAKSVRFNARLEVMTTLPGLAVPDGAGTACMRLTGIALTGPLSACVEGDAAPTAVSIGGRYDAFGSAQIIAPSGDAYVVWAGRENGAIDLRDDAGAKARIDLAGAQVAIGDLDQDGSPEIVASLDTTNPRDDAVVVWTWARRGGAQRGGGSLKELLRIPAPSGVHAVAVCPPDGPGRAPFIVATADEIWVVR